MKRRFLVLALIMVAGLAFLGQPVFAVDGAAETQNFIKSIITTLVGISGVIAVGFVVYGGILYIMSSGKPDNLDKAKNTLKYAGIGLVIVLAAYALVDFVSNMAKSSFGS